MLYSIVIEGKPGSYSAYVPDLPGCVTAGETMDEVTHDMAEAIQLHIEGMKEDGLPIPEPTTQVEYIEI